jgi:hypothetical protein
MINAENKIVKKKIAIKFLLIEKFIVRLFDLNYHIQRHLYPRIIEE